MNSNQERTDRRQFALDQATKYHLTLAGHAHRETTPATDQEIVATADVFEQWLTNG